MTQCSLSTLHQGLADIGNTKCGFVGRNDLVVDHGTEVQVDIVLGHAALTGHFDNLDLNIHRCKMLAQWVHFDQTGIDGTFESGRTSIRTYILK